MKCIRWLSCSSRAAPPKMYRLVYGKYDQNKNNKARVNSYNSVKPTFRSENENLFVFFCFMSLFFFGRCGIFVVISHVRCVYIICSIHRSYLLNMFERTNQRDKTHTHKIHFRPSQAQIIPHRILCVDRKF